MNHNVWVCFPTANADRAIPALNKWIAQGYNVAFYADSDDEAKKIIQGLSGEAKYFYCTEGFYHGYWAACNMLVGCLFHDKSRLALQSDRASIECDLVVCAADDMDPDPNKRAQEIATEYFERFPTGLGVMQPCGDDQGSLIDGKWASQRICGSPWFGRDFFDLRLFAGEPLPAMFYHFYGDELLKDISDAVDILWMREDLTQFHHHWSWGHGPREDYQKRNSASHWKEDKKRYERIREDYIEEAKRKMEAYSSGLRKV